ncbi:hypothetical protein PQX77_014176 [Marasmius sp. AFHP31]|nr:hypothetical protein PQX77_014176 [Marasmius sp. AFHP31]
MIAGTGSNISLESFLLFASEGVNVTLADTNLSSVEKPAQLLHEHFSDDKAIPVKSGVGIEDQVKDIADRPIKEYVGSDAIVTPLLFLALRAHTSQFHDSGLVHLDDNVLTTPREYLGSQHAY